MRTFNVVIERDPDTNLYGGYVPGGRARTAKGKPWTSYGDISRRSWACCSRMASRSLSPSSSASKRSRSDSVWLRASSQGARSGRRSPGRECGLLLAF